MRGTGGVTVRRTRGRRALELEVGTVGLVEVGRLVAALDFEVGLLTVFVALAMPFLISAEL